MFGPAGPLLSFLKSARTDGGAFGMGRQPGSVDPPSLPQLDLPQVGARQWFMPSN